MTDFSQYLDFEKPVVEIETAILEARKIVESGDLSKTDEVKKLKKKLTQVRKDVYGNLTSYQRVRLSRHFERPFTKDYIDILFEDFNELHGDRLFGDDAAIIGGIAKFSNQNVLVIGHQRGRTTQERISRNFGMTMPEGNRKGQRLFKLAEKFKLPLIMFIDTQGAYPGLDAEARGQAEAIARNLLVLSGLKTPMLSIVIGEGGSGGALAFGVCDRLLMLENSIYSVISPEGCASILWGKTNEDMAKMSAQAAESLKVTAKELNETGIVDDLVKEPPGGAHRDHHKAAEFLGEAISKHLEELCSFSTEDLLEKRYERIRKIGNFK